MSAATTQPLLLYTAATPNGHKASIFLEELKATYGLAYEARKVNLRTDEQKEAWFLQLNPNGRIPVLVDRNRGDFAVFESAAILLYLEQHYDPRRAFGFDPAARPDEYSELLQWIFFTHGGIGPMQGQAGHFVHAAPEDIPYAKKRYQNETKRLYGVLEIRLKDRDYLVGPGRGVYTIADMNAVPWVRKHAFVGIDSIDEWPSVKAWIARIEERPAVKAGLEVPQ